MQESHSELASTVDKFNKLDARITQLEELKSTLKALTIVAALIGITGAGVVSHTTSALSDLKSLEEAKNKFDTHANTKMKQILESADRTFVRTGQQVSLKAVDPNNLHLYHIGGTAYVDKFPSKSDDKDNYRFTIEPAIPD